MDIVREVFAAIDQEQVGAVTSLINPGGGPTTQTAAVTTDLLNVVVSGIYPPFVKLDQHVGQTAVRLRADYNVCLSDALQLAAAINRGCDAFLTNGFCSSE